MNATVYSFYSYKGGVGRSMTLANLAALFYRRPLDVIVVDWDLEAPGIERYFADQYPAARPDDLAAHPGLIDMIRSYRDVLATEPKPHEEPASPYPDLDAHLITLDEDRGCRLRLLTAGDRHDWGAYAEFVQTFDWADFHRHWAGGGFFDWLREGLQRRADIVLIDARTGITEMGGVATRQMGDVVVIIFAGNEENMASSARMAQAFLAPHDEGRSLGVILVPSRIDDSDTSEFGDFLKRLAEIEQQLGDNAPPDGWQTLDLLLPYRAALAFREQLIVGDEERQSVLGPLVEGYRRIAGNMQRYAPEGSRLRLGAGVARGRVYLLDVRHQPLSAEVRSLLEQEGYEVLPATSAVSNVDRDPSELASAGCVLVLLDRKTAASREVQSVVAYAERLGKPVIPVVLDDGVQMPLALANTVPLNWFDGRLGPRVRSMLLDSIRVANATPAEPGLSSSSDAQGRVFISYASADSGAVHDLAESLRALGIDAWLDEYLTPGIDLLQARERALADSQAVVVVLSPAFVESRASQQEVAYASEMGKPILSVLIEPTRLPLSLSDRVYVDAIDLPPDAVAARLSQSLWHLGDEPA